MLDDDYNNQLQYMIEHQIRDRGVRDEEVLKAMKSVPRHLFVPQDLESHAYDDRPLPIGYGQTISQPYIVALMTALLKINPEDSILEIGSGCGYQTAVLSRLCKMVYAMDIIDSLVATAIHRLKRLNIQNVVMASGNGREGWEEHSPFNGILVAAASHNIPKPLIDQLAPGGRLVIPVGDEYFQDLLVIQKTSNGIQRNNIIPVRFVPLVEK